LKIARLSKKFTETANALVLTLQPHEILPFKVLSDTLKNLFAIGEAIFTRSAMNIFPFHIQGTYLYRQAELLLEMLCSNRLQGLWAGSFHNPKFYLIRTSLKTFRDLLCNVVNDIEIITSVLQLETIYSVFLEGRKILDQNDKSEKEIRDEISVFTKSIDGLSKWDKRYHTIQKRFKMYDRELYVAYDSEWVPRTNNDLEYFNNTVKLPIRKNRGQKSSWFYMEHLGESIAFQQNFNKASYDVGGTKIQDEDIRSPLERLGLLKDLRVSTIFKSINISILIERVKKIDDRYTVHRWVCRLRKKGVSECVDEIIRPWEDLVWKLKKIGVKNGI